MLTGPFEALPTGAVEVERKLGANGQERSVYALSTEHEDFIASADMLMGVDFKDAEYAESLDEARPALSYIPGQILYYHGHSGGSARTSPQGHQGVPG